jgi:hypothetical protein
MFDQRAWRRDFRQLGSAMPPDPHFSVLETLTIENERAVRQQALSTVTNVDDVEAYISMHEAQGGQKYLFAVDLEHGQRDDILKEIRLMGITDGTMFPGLDGLCKELRALNFGHDV